MASTVIIRKAFLLGAIGTVSGTIWSELTRAAASGRTEFSMMFTMIDLPVGH
jgi:hypothetical protein